MNKSEQHFDYIAESHQTLSSSYYGERIALSDFHEAVAMAINALGDLDRIKKALFYGKSGTMRKPVNGEATLQSLPGFVGGDEINAINIVHAIIGKATESGELLEALERCINGQPLDYPNAREEVGDGLWYDAILLRAIGSNFDEAQRVNIAKLRHRFPEKFTEYDANNRDLLGERVILENNA